MSTVTKTSPGSEETHKLVALFNEGRFGEAETLARTLTAQFPLHGFGWKVLGAALKLTGRGEEALEPLRKAASLAPGDAEAHSNLGNALRDIWQLDDAVASFCRALEIKPDFAGAYSNLGCAYHDLWQLDEAVASYRRALEIKPDFAEAHSNLGDSLRDLGQLDEAVASCRRALEINPDYPDAHYNLGTALLARGDLAQGWEEFEWRMGIPQMIHARRNFVQPQWRGEPAEGRTLLIHAEQGLGDTLQFCRYATLAAACGLRVILEVPRPLVRLLRSLQGVDLVMEYGNALPPFDLHCPMLSLPYALKTTLATIPAAIPYLQADKAQVSAWRTRLALLPRQGTRVGLVWAGNPRAHSPELTAIDRRRSVAPQLLAPLFDLPGFHFFSLQKGGAAAPADFPLTDFMGEMGDFADTAALIANLDLVISVDTSVAHLAAALGKPVWLLNRYDTCWRWLQERQDSPWYPSLRLFRQQKSGDWSSVVEKVVAELGCFRPDIDPA